MAQKMPIKLQELCAASLTHPLPSHRRERVWCVGPMSRLLT